jgi:ribosome maturation protein Sdo1
MNSPEYKKAYMKNLKHQIDMEKIYTSANKGQPSTQQYIQNTGQTILGVSLNGNETKGTNKIKGNK